MRVSPNEKSTTLKKPAKNTSRGTGVYGARTDYPPSTNVSSPIQAASKRRAAPHPKISLTNDDCAKNDFVVDDDSEDAFDEPVSIKRPSRMDNHHPEQAGFDESDEEFGPVREVGQPQRSRKRTIGPPITTDEKLESLNSIHREVVEFFMIEAKKESTRVSTLENSSIRTSVPYVTTDSDAQRSSSSAIFGYCSPRDGHQLSKR